jgi:hypothetical protein
VIAETVTTTVQSDHAVASSPDSFATDNPVKVIDAICGRGSIDDSLAGDTAIIHRLGGLARYFATA